MDNLKQVLCEGRKRCPSINSKEKMAMGKMKRAVKKILGVLAMATLLAETSGFTSVAAESVGLSEQLGENVEVLEATVVEDFDWSSNINPYTMLTDCIIGVSGASDGMHIDISTGVVGTASVLGIKDVKIYKKTWYGGWDYVAYSSGGEAKNCGTMGINILYENAVKDATYKITCIHYGNVDGYTEGSHDSGAFVYTY